MRAVLPETNVTALLQKPALELSMGMSGDFEQAIAMCVVVVLIIGAHAIACCCNSYNRNSMNAAFIIVVHFTIRGATNVRLGSTIFGAR